MKKILLILVGIFVITTLNSQTYRSSFSGSGSYNSTTGTYRGSVTINGKTTYTTIYSNGTVHSYESSGGNITPEEFAKQDSIYKAWWKRYEKIKEFDNKSITKYYDSYGSSAIKFGYNDSIMIITGILDKMFGHYYYVFGKNQTSELIKIFEKADEMRNYCIKNNINNIDAKNERKELGTINGITFYFEVFYNRYSIIVDDVIFVGKTDELKKYSFSKEFINDFNRAEELIKKDAEEKKIENNKRIVSKSYYDNL